MSSTARATSTGFFTRSSPATAPKRPPDSITEASIWIDPSSRTMDPVPALKRGSSSSTTAPATAASSGSPVAASRARATSTARRGPSAWSGLDPTPPWATAAGFQGVGGRGRRGRWRG